MANVAKKKNLNSSQPKTLNEYLARLPEAQRAALEKLRRAIRAAAPGVEEKVSYGVGAFCWKGTFLVGIGAAKKHCAFYLGSTLRMHLDELEGYDLSTGTIRFQPEKPLPLALVRKLVKSRLAQRESSRPGGAKGRRKIAGR